MHKLGKAWLLACWLLAGAAGADDAQIEQRLNRLAEELRCLSCQSQSLADSHTPLAMDLKNQLREQLAQGRSDDEARAYLVQRYGDFVLYRPPLRLGTWLLWFGPWLLLAAGLAVLALRWRRDRAGDRAEDGEPT